MKKRISIIMLMFCVIIFILTISSKAGYSSTDPVVSSGGTATITISSSESLQNFDLKLGNYNGLTYSGCSSSSDAAVVNSGNGSISYASAGSGTKTLGTYTFKVPEVSTTTKYTVSFNINGTTNTSTITVNPKNGDNNSSNSGSAAQNNSSQTTSENGSTQEKSKVATLSNLGIKPNDFKGFSAAKTSYDVEVPYETDKIEIYATKGQAGQTITGIGTNKELKEGANKFDIEVTAEDGTTKKTYTLNITRKTKDGENTENSEGTKFGLSELKIEGIKLTPEFKIDVYEYKATLKENLDKLNITAKSKDEKAKIEITGNENLKDGENTITILVKGENEADTVAYQILLDKKVTVTTHEDDSALLSAQNSKQKKIRIISIILIIAIVGIVTIIIVVKRRHKYDDEYMYDEDEMNDFDDSESDIFDAKTNNYSNYIDHEQQEAETSVNEYNKNNEDVKNNEKELNDKESESDNNDSNDDVKTGDNLEDIEEVEDEPNVADTDNNGDFEQYNENKNIIEEIYNAKKNKLYGENKEENSEKKKTLIDSTEEDELETESEDDLEDTDSKPKRRTAKGKRFK